MSKLLSVLAYAGDKPAAAAAAANEVYESATRAALHGDRSYLVDTAKECSGKTRIAAAVRESLDHLSNMLQAFRSGATLTQSVDAPAWRAEFTLPILPEGLTLAALTAEGKKPAALSDAVAPWSREVAARWLAATVKHCDAAAAAAKAKREASAAEKAANAPTTDASTPTTDASTPTTDAKAFTFDQAFAAGKAEGDEMARIAQANAARSFDAMRAAEARAAEAEARAIAAEARAIEAEASAAASERAAMLATERAIAAEVIAPRGKRAAKSSTLHA